MRNYNSFTLSNTDIEKGIQLLESEDGHPIVRIGEDHSHTDIRLGNKWWKSIPSCTPSLVIRSKPLWVGNFLRLILPPKEWNGIVVRVIARDLDFPIEPFANDLNLNPGGEGATLIVRRGAHTERFSKDQLFVVEPYQRLLVIDQKKAVMLITCRNGVPEMRPALRDELIEYLVEYGLHSRGRNEVAWAMNAINRLGEGIHPELQEKLSEIIANNL